jgi:orotidine-5'-phosphate decarboxylase
VKELLVALDVDTADQAVAIARSLAGVVGGVKVGSRLFTSEGPSIVGRLTDVGHRVFVDMMRAAARAAADAAATGAVPRPLVIAVTVLTSLDQAALARVGIGVPVVDQVDALAALAAEAGLDGVVASPQETRRLRERRGAEFVIVTPGIRGASAAGERLDDQARTLSAPEALAAGASYLVVGRPILAAPDPRAAAQAIAASCASIR